MSYSFGHLLNDDVLHSGKSNMYHPNLTFGKIAGKVAGNVSGSVHCEGFCGNGLQKYCQDFASDNAKQEFAALRRIYSGFSGNYRGRIVYNIAYKYVLNTA